MNKKSPEIPERLPLPYGSCLDRNTRIHFRFEGEPCEGFGGDTLSTALWASGARVLGRSFKYHRPRGVFSLSGIDANVLVEDSDTTNIRGDRTPVHEGMDVRAVNTLGGVRRDLLRVLGRLEAFTPVGFYYKAFHTPRSLYPLYESMLRRLGGLGRVNAAKPIEHTAKRYAFCDVLVVGAGASGMAAAVAASARGARVLLVGNDLHRGGCLRYHKAQDPKVLETLARLESQLAGQPLIEWRASTTAVSHDADLWVALDDAKTLTKVQARAVVYATGCYEQPAVFRNNDLPGVMLLGAAQRLVHEYAVRPCEAAVVFAARLESYEAALDLSRAGVAVRAIVDPGVTVLPEALAEALASAQIPIRTKTCVYEAIPLSGEGGVAAAVICALDPQGVPQPESAEPIPCDGVLLGVAQTPADALLRQAGACMRYDATQEQFVPEQLPERVYAVGSVNGVHDLDVRIADGRAAGEAVAISLGFSSGPAPSRPARTQTRQSHPYPIFPHSKGHECLDLDEDLMLKDVQRAVAEGFDRVELLKRYSAFGMGPSQGKHSNLNVLRVLARLRGETLEGHRAPTARPYVQPVPLSHLAGRIFTPRLRTTIHRWHEADGAEFTWVGAWLRPKYYRVQGRTEEQCIADEATAARCCVGLIDVGTLGKIEVSGPDAALFLEYMNTGRYADLPPGKAGYGLMCDESGVVINDGIIARLSEEQFYVTTTTTGADAIFLEMRRNALSWKHRVTLVHATHQFGAVSVAGPASRALLAGLVKIDMGEDAFPHMAVRSAEIAGVPVWMLRVGFAGKLGYEVHMPASGALQVWSALMEAGAECGARPCGVEAQRLLRLDMGHFLIGQDTDALTHPYEIGMGWTVKMDKPFFIGQRSLRILSGKPRERQLVGFVLSLPGEGNRPAENHLIIREGRMAGRITSIGRSPALGRTVGLAYVEPDQTTPGTELFIRSHNGGMVSATVAHPPFVGEAMVLSEKERSFKSETVATQTEKTHAASAAGGSASVLALCDVSAIPKWGLAGPGATDWLRAKGIAVPEGIYQWRHRKEDAGRIVRLPHDEFFIEDSPGGGHVAALRAAYTDNAPGCHAVERQDYALLVCGDLVAELMAQSCGVDFSKPHEVAVMTRVAGVNVLALQTRETQALRLWCARSAAVYLWDALAEIVHDLSGAVADLDHARPWL